jgi:glycerate 2-kinase
LSAIKGGKLLKFAPKVNWFSLIISDVPGNDLSVIASGPTVRDNTTFQDAWKVLEKYNLTGQLPAAILEHFAKGNKEIVTETPPANEPIYRNVQNRVIGSNSIALAAAAAKASALGLPIPFIEKDLVGDAATIGRELVRSCKNYTGIKPACFLLGGETTVQVTGKGKGGRNQHLVLSALLELAVHNDETTSNKITLLSAGTDGTDGPTDAAGAIADSSLLSIAFEKKLDVQKYFSDNDAYHFFEQTGGLLKTGATQTNVMDLVVVIVE